MIERGRVLLAILAGGLVCACEKSPPPADKPAAPSRPAADKSSLLPPQMVAAVSASRSSLIVGVHFALGAPPTVGIPLPVDIAVLPHQPFTKLTLHISSQDGLRVVSGAEMPTQTSVAAGKVLTHKITLEPTREGVFMVTAAVETEAEEGTITRVYSIPIIVSTATAPAPASVPGAGSAPPPA